MFERIPEKEIMDDKEQAEAYSSADFSEPHSRFVDLASKLVESKSHKSILDIGIGDADVVQINQGDAPHCGSGQSFCRPGADTTETNNTDVGLTQLL